MKPENELVAEGNFAEAYWRAKIAKDVEIFINAHATYTNEELLFIVKGKR